MTDLRYVLVNGNITGMYHIKVVIVGPVIIGHKKAEHKPQRLGLFTKVICRQKLALSLKIFLLFPNKTCRTLIFVLRHGLTKRRLLCKIWKFTFLPNVRKRIPNLIQHNTS